MSQSGEIIETYAKTIIVIDCSTEEEQYEYRCIAKNPVSNASSSELSFNECVARNWNGEKLTVDLFTIIALQLHRNSAEIEKR